MAAPVCEACSKPASRPLLACLDCIETCDTHNQLTPTYYCQTRCKEAHESKHQTVCDNNNVRTQLIRAAELLQKTFHAFRFAAFDRNIQRVKKDGGILHVQEGDPKETFDKGPIIDFPYDLVPDKNDRATLATYRACDHSLDFMYEMSKELLQELTVTIEEIRVKVNWSKVAIRYWRHDKKFELHTVPGHVALAVEALDGEAYVIDLAGSQYGQHRSIVPFDEYMKTFALRVRGIQPHGDKRKFGIAVRNGEKNHEMGADWDYRVYHLLPMVHTRLLKAKQEWEIANKTTILELVERDKAGYAKGQVSFIVKIMDAMLACVDEWRKGGRKLPPRPTPQLSYAERKVGDVDPHAPLGARIASRAYRQWLKDRGQQVQLDDAKMEWEKKMAGLPNALDELYIGTEHFPWK